MPVFSEFGLLIHLDKALARRKLKNQFRKYEFNQTLLAEGIGMSRRNVIRWTARLGLREWLKEKKKWRKAMMRKGGHEYFLNMCKVGGSADE